MADLKGDAQVPQLFTKRIRIHGDAYDLAVIKNDETNWHWFAFLLRNDEVLERRKPIVNERNEAMKEAHFLASLRETKCADYPDNYARDWRELPILSSGFIV